MAALLWLAVPRAAVAQDCVDTGLAADCDGDGFALADGDCDDEDPKVHPSAKEVCGDQLDNDCNGLFDDDCDDAVRQGTIGGGGGCTADTALDGTAAVVFLPLVALVARRREEPR